MSPLHVLIIEDEPLIALDIRAMLEDQGADSFAFAETQGDAIKAARSHKPDIITSDVTLRVGLGPDAVAEIHRTHGPTPVIFITASPEACGTCAPPARVLRKPVDEAAVVDAFRALALD